MPRRRCRRIFNIPNITTFKPVGVPGFSLEEVILSFDELEALRLKDLEGKDQTTCAKLMGISQPTFNRILNAGRNKIADALVNGKIIQIEKRPYVVYEAEMNKNEKTDENRDE